MAFVCVDIQHRFVTRPLLASKKYFRLVLFSIYIFLLAFWLESVLTFILHLYFWEFLEGSIVEQASEIRYQVGGLNMVIFGGVMIHFMLETFRLHQLSEQRHTQSIERDLQLKEVELNLLKSQVNPHFLFNALNCIYGLSLEKSAQTPKVIMQLSEILDYILYRCNKKVLLSDELKQIENYTAIQKVRFGKTLQLLIENNNSKDFEIEPLVLLTLVENAFKHGKPNSNGVLLVEVLVQSSESFLFKIKNTIDPVMAARTKGIGLTNLQRRLELLYANNYELIIDPNNSEFVACLTIKSDENGRN